MNEKDLHLYILEEFLETLANICMFIEKEGRRTCNPVRHLLEHNCYSLRELATMVREKIAGSKADDDQQ